MKQNVIQQSGGSQVPELQEMLNECWCSLDERSNCTGFCIFLTFGLVAAELATGDDTFCQLSPDCTKVGHIVRQEQNIFE